MQIIDLTQEIDESTQVFPGSPKVSLLQWSNYESHKFASEVIFCSTHIGTHIDAPYHFKRGGCTVESISLGKLIVQDKIKVLKIERKDNEIIEIDDLKNQQIMENDSILINTDWSKYKNMKKYFTKNPGLSKAAADYLAKIKINLIGIDSPNIDPASDGEFSSHKIFSENNIPILENLMNLDKLLNKKFTLIALPLKLKNCSGSPIRAVAIQDE
ncbi:MAG TPA: cyclase family protein [Candidatus Nitrosocosmicus sp.]|nr:cyclase family protein [Candidatus Nitrosocosmicus sp.]